MPEQPAAIEFRGVSRCFGGRPVLSDFSLAVLSGETVALLGPSGSGKTTALKLVNRLLEPDSGEILVAGRRVADEDPVRLRRGIGYVIQEAGLLPHWDVEANVEIVPRLLGWDAPARRARAEKLLEMVHLPLSEYGSRRPRELSGGQRQRVGFARALAADPPVLLLDEPFGALDPIARRGLQKEFQEWKRELRQAVVLVTHDVAEAFRLADRVAVIEGGRVRQVGTPRDLVERPADEFVREFVSGESS